MLAALLLWRRLLVSQGDGSAAALGRTSYWGTAPLDPAAFGRAGGQRLVDVLESSVAGVESRFAVAETGAVVGVDLWTSPDADPCEVRFTAVLPDHPQGMPAVIEVRHGNELFGVFRVESAVLEVEDAAARPDAGNRVPPGGGT
jgi:hypothetical protein